MPNETVATGVAMSWKHEVRKNALPSNSYFWQLERPKPALPNSYFWTWDHSTNWVLDDPGLQNSGCYNKYFKQPGTFLEDYRRLTDAAAGLGIKGIVIWGFLRDAHGGVEYAKRVAEYAAARNVAILPGVGVTWYGGVYYEGAHPYNLSAFLRKYPEARLLDEKGELYTYSGEYGASPGHPAFRDWLKESLRWLFREFAIGGLNIENGDMNVDFHPLTQALRKDWPADDPEPFFFQGLCYREALTAIENQLAGSLTTYATYTGFNYTDEPIQNTGMGKKPPAMLKIMPEQSIAQWTLTGMLLPQALPLTAFLEDGAPRAAFENPNWPEDLRPPNKRSVGFMHQGSQWHPIGRYECTVSAIKEACLRAYRSGLEGVSIHGEVTSRYIPSALNYLAFSHFTHWPEDSLRDFGRKTLAQVLGSEKDGEDFARILAHWDAGTLTDDLKKLASPSNHGFASVNSGSESANPDEQQRYNFWLWLHGRANSVSSRHNCSNMLLI
jgi:hypothetical protein